MRSNSGKDQDPPSPDPVIIRDAVEREGQHQLPGTGRPPQCRLRIAHALPGSNHAPQDV